MFRQILRNTGSDTSILPFVSVTQGLVLHNDLLCVLHIQHRKRVVLNQLKNKVRERDEKMIKQILDEIIEKIISPPISENTRDVGIPYCIFESLGNYIWESVRR